MKGVRELCLQFSAHQNGLNEMNRYRLPSWLFECEKLVYLELYSCKVEVPDDVCFSSLRVLSLIQIELSGRAIDKLLAGCPLLENLTIISGVMALKQENGYGDVKSLPENLRRAKVLTLCRRSIRLMSISQLQNLLSYVSKTKCLSLTTLLLKNELQGIANILRTSNELETLIIRLDAVHHDRCTGKDYLEILTYGFPSLVHLKTIKIIGFMMYVQYSLCNKYPTWFIDSLNWKMNLIRLLLNNAKMLQKIIIHLPRTHRSPNIGVGAMRPWLKIKQLVCQQFTGIPGVSSSAQVLFSDY
ncbi:F-box/FBD/LRR-repeat-like protein [Cinnamomum micranthum f. kanehirae]|uniref:F-box/FBD/LRR-repeat-like protein n=1 Tax=Cinnamomum micranthum f. kanehirae TaxID=337451 RepID=A0A443PHW1_9MAGN|nr:F-box/FBD/LRR-repeat-like protein [Cinnamomum micranthum f. kanehirae]